MYRITYWDAKYGDKQDVRTADTFAAAVTDVFNEIGSDPAYDVSVSTIEGAGSLTVTKDDVTVAAVIKDSLDVGNSRDDLIASACKAVELGHFRPLIDIFTKSNAPAPQLAS